MIVIGLLTLIGLYFEEFFFKALLMNEILLLFTFADFFGVWISGLVMMKDSNGEEYDKL